MTQMLAQREHDYFAETVICANIYIITKFNAENMAAGNGRSDNFIAIIRLSLHLLCVLLAFKPQISNLKPQTLTLAHLLHSCGVQSIVDCKKTE